MALTSSIKNATSVIANLNRRSKRILAWDVFMVWVAVINLWMILFDLTYLWLRPVYFNYVPVVTRVYDPVKGIGPHPLTEALLEELPARARDAGSGLRFQTKNTTFTTLLDHFTKDVEGRTMFTDLFWGKPFE